MTMHPISNVQPLTSKALRIGFDAKRAFNNGTGLGNYARFVINGMLKHFPQHEYFLFTPTISAAFEHFYDSTPNVKLITPDSLLGKTFPSFWRTYVIAEMCNELELDVFHGLSNELPVGIEQFKGQKLVTIHDLIFLRYPNYYKNIDRYIYTRKFKYACAEADTIIATSLQTQNDIVHYFGTAHSKIAVGYQNCSELFDQPTMAHLIKEVTNTYHLPEQYILCVGTIEQRKNQLTVLKAFHQLLHPTCKLVFIGKQTAYASELIEYCNQHQLTDAVIFLQDIPSQLLPAMYQLASAFVYASEFEGFGIPVLEGLRSNIPVIVANASSLPEVGGEYVLYFEPTDFIGLSNQLKKVLHTFPQKEGLATYLQKFDTQQLMVELEQHYHNGVTHI